MTVLFQRRDIEQYTDSLSDYLPGGRLFASKNIKDSNFRKLLRGLAGELFRANGLLRDYSREVLPDTTERFINEWERALAIPDGCFTGAGTLQERRRDVVIKLSSLGAQTAEDFEAIAALFGIDVTVVGGKDPSVSPAITPDKTARFTIVIKYAAATGFDYEFDFEFGTDDTTFLACIYNRIRPANCQVLFQSV
jgi:uncharacterized protein YmfQ (DUF2313 family)